MIERRFAKRAEIRAKGDGHIAGHAAVFGDEYVMWDGDNYRVVEKVKRGAFSRPIREQQDVRCLANHNPNNLLGRTASKTLSLKEDDQGLYFDNIPPDTQFARDLYALIKRGDISGCSFAFTVTKETVTEQKVGSKTVRTREIEDVDLFDVGPVTYPAYEGTDVNARTMEMRGAMFPVGVPPILLRLLPQLRDSMQDSEERERAAALATMERVDQRFRDAGMRVPIIR